MNHFEFRDGVLHAEDVPVPEIARTVGTPFYCYSTATLERHYNVFKQSFTGARLARLLRHEGEFEPGGDHHAGPTRRRRRCRLRGRDAPCARGRRAGGKILFSGVGKTAREMDFALAAGILCFNVESEPELELLSARAVAAGKIAPVSLRINPDVDAKTHTKISTGNAENKFGVPRQRARAVYARAAELPGIRVTGIDMHIGSQITDLRAFRRRLLDPCRSRRHAARRRPPDQTTSISAAGSACPTAIDNDPPPHLPDAYADIIRSPRRSSRRQGDVSSPAG